MIKREDFKTGKRKQGDIVIAHEYDPPKEGPLMRVDLYGALGFVDINNNPDNLMVISFSNLSWKEKK